MSYNCFDNKISSNPLHTDHVVCVQLNVKAWMGVWTKHVKKCGQLIKVSNNKVHLLHLKLKNSQS